MSTQKVTLAHGPDGYVVHATLTAFNPDSEADMEIVRALDSAIERRSRVFVFDDSFEVEHIFEPDATTEVTR